MYKPCKIREMNTLAIHKKPIEVSEYGIVQKEYISATHPNLKGKFKQKGTNDVVNGIAVDYEKIEFISWFKADVEKGDALEIDGELFLIVGKAENVEKRNRYLICTLERIE